MRFSSPISCITPLDARQESLPTSRRGKEDPWARVVHSNERRPANPARKTSLAPSGAPAKLGRAFRPTSAERARGSRKKPPTVRGERAARRVSVDTPQ